MQTFEVHKVVEQGNIDQLSHVNNVIYVQWVQDVAEEHWKSRVTNEIENDYFWVLLEHHIKYRGQAILGDVLKLITYVERSEGVKSVRKVNIYNHNTDELLVESTTIWCLISKAKNKPSRITAEIKNLFN